MVAQGCGIKDSVIVSDIDAFRSAAARALGEAGPLFVVARVERSIARVKPKSSDIFEDKYRFARYVEKSESIEILSPPVRRRRDPNDWSSSTKGN
jgi:hypothetical protein